LATNRIITTQDSKLRSVSLNPDGTYQIIFDLIIDNNTPCECVIHQCQVSSTNSMRLMHDIMTMQLKFDILAQRDTPNGDICTFTVLDIQEQEPDWRADYAKYKSKD
jgi:hypothetical protein